MNIEIKHYSNIYSTPDKKGKQKLIKSNVLIKHYINTEDIVNITTIYSRQGNLYKTKCKITHDKLGEIIVDVPYEKMKQIKEDSRIIVHGFRR
jgi:hypothetical protein